MRFSKKTQEGFTLIELLVVLSLFASFFVLATVRLFSSVQQTTSTSTLTMLISDIKSAQIKAMTGDTQGTGSNNNYGIYFGNNQYTLFTGSYIPGNATNFSIPLGGNLQFINNTIPAGQLIFLKGSGEVSGYVSGQDGVTLTDTQSAEQKTITVNRYGVIKSVN